MSKMDEVLGAQRATAETVQIVRRGCEHCATTQFAIFIIKLLKMPSTKPDKARVKNTDAAYK